MLELREDQSRAIEGICRRQGVWRLEVFGSATRAAFDAEGRDLAPAAG